MKKLIILCLTSILAFLLTGMTYASVLFHDTEFLESDWKTHGNGSVERSSDITPLVGSHSLRKFNNNDGNGGFRETVPFGRNFILEGWLYRETVIGGGNAERLTVVNSNDDGYGFAITQNNIRVEKRVNDARSNLGSLVSWTRPEQQWFRFRFTANDDDTLTLEVFNSDGTVAASVTSAADSDFNSFDRVTVQGGTVYYVDNLKLSLQSENSVALVQTPYEAGVQVDPNILLILDNSNSMVEDTTGAVAASCNPGPAANCIAGSAAPTSKSETIRGVARNIVNDYENRINLGLMAYQQHPARTNRSPAGGTASNIVRWDLVDRIYDVSYNPANFNSNFQFDLTTWDSNTKRFRIPNPTDANNFIHFNIRVPGYTSGTGAVQFCRTRETGNGYLTENFLFRCYTTKTGTSDNFSTNDNNTAGGYGGTASNTSGSLNDSARARGVTHWGQRMVALPFNREEWLSSGSPGLGYLHIPIAPLTTQHRNSILTKLGVVPYPNTFNADIITDPAQPLINAGLTPIEGTLLTATDYWSSRGASSGTNFGNNQGFANATPMPESCGADATIWLTDGMPSADQSGNVYGANVALALADAVSASESLRNTGESDLFVVGFAMPPTVSPTQLQQLAPDVNGQPRSFLADNAAQLDNALRGIFDSILSDSVQSTTSVALSSQNAGPGNNIFVSQYTSSDWSGEIRSLDFVTGQTNWNTNQTYRTTMPNTPVYTINTATQTGVQLLANQLSSLSINQQIALSISPSSNTPDGREADRVSWLLGNDNLAGFRTRRNNTNQFLPMGDIVNAAPVYYGGKRYFGYDLLPGSEGSKYLNYSASSRPEALFVGANDGKLHVFNPDNGSPLFAYLPGEFLNPSYGESSTAARINSLMREDYSHKFYVDGNVTYSDVYINNAWKTVLVGTLGNGGRSVYALNITNPHNFTASNDVLWEFTHPDLGFGVKDASIVRLANGTWAAVFGNGYNSVSNRSKLFVVDIETGDLIRAIDTGQGSSASPNGLAGSISTDWPKLNLITAYTYAGDLLGNLWRFDLRSTDPSDWSANLVFSARDQDNAPQPITAKPQLTAHPDNSSKLIVLFGTGSYFRVNDNSNTDTQTFYGIHDQPADPSFIAPTRTNLVERSIHWSGMASGYEVRQVTNTPNLTSTDQGWYLDFDEIPGERIVSQARTPLRGFASRVIFNTLIPIPSTDVCTPPSRDGFIMALNPVTGARIDNSIFDINQDGEFDDADKVNNISVSGVRFGSGSSSQSALGDGTEIFIDETGEQLAMEDSQGSGRVSWQEIR